MMYTYKTRLNKKNNLYLILEHSIVWQNTKVEMANIKL